MPSSKSERLLMVLTIVLLMLGLGVVGQLMQLLLFE